MIVKLEAVNALAQLIAALGVIVSLFYLAAQIWQNTRSMRVLVDSFDASKHARRPVEARNLRVEILCIHKGNPQTRKDHFYE